jgi:ABC-2 type transport system ATP-binding protein
LLGPNGAGKSTFMDILSTVVKPTTGAAYWNGTDISVNTTDKL